MFCGKEGFLVTRDNAINQSAGQSRNIYNLTNIYFHLGGNCSVAGQVFWLQKEVALSSKHMSQGCSRNLVVYHSMKGVFNPWEFNRSTNLLIVNAFLLINTHFEDSSS